MTNEDLRNLVIGLYRKYSPSTNTDDGSLVRVQFIDPLVRMLELPDDSTATDDFISDRLRQEFPELDAENGGSAFAEILKKAPALIVEPLRRNLAQLRRERGGLGTPELLTEQSAEALAGNFFTGAIPAGHSAVSVRMYFQRAARKVFTDGNLARTSSGITFRPASATEVTETEMQSNVATDGRYYCDVLFVAVDEGSASQIGKGSIYTVDGVTGLSSATNLDASSVVADAETPDLLAARIYGSLSDRSMVTVRGIYSLITTLVPDIQELLVVGFGDSEMERDVLKATWPSTWLNAETSLNGSLCTEPIASGPFTIPREPEVPTEITSFPWTNRVKLDTELSPDGHGGWVPGGAYYDEAVIDGDVIFSERCRFVDSKDGEEYILKDFDILYPVDTAAGSARISTGGDGGSPFSVSGGAPLRRYPCIKQVHRSAALTDGDYCYVLNEAAWFYEGYDPHPWRVLGSGAGSGDYSSDTLVWFDLGFMIHGHGERILSKQSGPGENEWEIVVEGLWTPRYPEDETGGTFLTLDDSTDIHRDRNYLVKSVEHDTVEGTTTIVVDVNADSYPEERFPHDAEENYPPPEPSFFSNPTKWTLWSADDFDHMLPATLGSNAHAIVIRVNGMELENLVFRSSSVPNTWSYSRFAQVTTPEHLSVSDIPGGILRPDAGLSTVSVPNDTVHIGGKADVYVFPRTSYTRGTLTLSNAMSVNPNIVAKARWIAGSDLVTLYDVHDLSHQFLEGTFYPICLMLKNGDVFDVYRVVHEPPISDEGGAYVLRVAHTFSSDGETDVALVYERIDLHLGEPKSWKARGSDLRTHVGSSVVTFGANSVDIGAAAGDILRILDKSSPNHGDYTISSVADGSYTLETPPKNAEEDLAFEVFTPQPESSMPIMRVSGVTMYDAYGTGVRIPDCRPLGAVVVRDFQTPEQTVFLPDSRTLYPYGTVVVDGDDFFLDIPKEYIDASHPVRVGDMVSFPVSSLNTCRYLITGVATEEETTYRIPISAGDRNADFSLQEPPDPVAETDALFRIEARALNGAVRVYYRDRIFAEWSSFWLQRPDDLEVYFKAQEKPTQVYSHTNNESDAYLAKYPTEEDQLALIVPNSTLHASCPPPTSLILETYDHFVAPCTYDSAAVVGKTLKFRVGDGPQITVMFNGSNPLPVSSSTYPGGIVEQINAASGDIHAYTKDDKLYITSGIVLRLLEGSTAASELGMVGLIGTTNATANKGPVSVTSILRADVDDVPCTVFIVESGKWETQEDGLRFRGFSSYCTFPGQMLQDSSTGLFYVDVEMESYGVTDSHAVKSTDVLQQADLWKLVLDQDVLPWQWPRSWTNTPTGFGYCLVNDNQSLAFSTAEDLRLVLTAGFMDPEAEDCLGSIYVVDPYSLVVDYEHCSQVPLAESLTANSGNRVVTADLLVKAARPARVLGAMTYSGGEQAYIVLPYVKEYIRSVPFGSSFDVSNIRTILRKFGASGFDNQPLMIEVQDKNRGCTLIQTTGRYRSGTDGVVAPFHFLPDEELLSLIRS